VRLQDLDEALRRYLAWSSILAEKEALNLDHHQVRQAEKQKQAADSAVTARLPETYQWVLVPEQKTPQSAVEWEAVRLSGNDSLAVRASKKLRSDELLVTSFGSTILRKHLDAVPLWRGEHVAVKQLVEDFGRYLYLPRLAGPEVLVHACRDGSLTPESAGLLVKPDVARRQMDAEVPPAAAPGAAGAGAGAGGSGAPGGPTSSSSSGDKGATPAGAAALPHRFHGTVALDPERVGRDASRIADEVIAHLSGLVSAEVRVTLEIEAEIPSGAPDQVVRTVTENSRTLKFTSHGFEKE
jgi:hypothetical protein